VVAHKLKGRVRVVASGCLDFCSKGCALVALRAPSDDPNHSPAAESWYTHLTARDASGVFRAQVLANQQDQAHLEITRQLESTKR
jgi:(2Fe-2S) ferredoxin